MNTMLLKKGLLIIFLLVVCFQGASYARDITLKWDPSSNPGPDGYRIYYATDSRTLYNPPRYDPVCADYDASNAEYSVDNGITWDRISNICPQPITVDDGVTEIMLRNLEESEDHYIALKALDDQGLESSFSREICALGSSSAHPYDKGWAITSGDLQGFMVLFNDNAPDTPTLGSSDEIPPLHESIQDVQGIGLPVNLQPSPRNFAPDYVKIFLPCPGYSTPSGLDIYFYDAVGGWALAWDASEQAMTPAGEDWMAAPPVPHNQDLVNNIPATYEVIVKHFSGAQAAALAGAGGGATHLASGGSSGCFISAIAER